MTSANRPVSADAAYRDIWSQFPERQGRMSSSWWFFLLFPEGPDGYGPRQLMFTVASRAGQQMNISGQDMLGFDPHRAADPVCDRFSATAVGWYCDGRQVFEDYVKEVATAELSRDEGTLLCLADNTGGRPHGMTISRSDAHPLAMQVEVLGREGSASFTTWGDLTAPHTSPDVTMDIQTRLGGVHYVAVRQLNFAGDFDLPTGREHLRGKGFFQRVALNAPLFPWKWIYTLFPDGSLFTAYVPYLGFNLTRKGYKFFSSERRERAALPISQHAAYFPAGATEPVIFNRVIVRPCLGSGPHPSFEVEARNGLGDSFAFFAATQSHARFYIDRPILGGKLTSHWTYNEYIIRMENLRGRVAGREISAATKGQGYGNIEYTWGLGL